MASNSLKQFYSRTTLLLSCFVLLLSACVSTGKLQDGDTAFRLGKYSIAAEMLAEEYDKTNNPVSKARIAQQIAICYDSMNNPEKTIEWLSRAVEQGAGTDAMLELALQLKKQEKYRMAINQFEAYLREEPDQRPEIKAQIASCRQAIEWKEGVHHFTVTNLEALNSAAEDFSPVFFEQNQLIYTSGREGATGDLVNEWNGGKFLDLFSVRYNGENFSTPEPFDLLVNSEYEEGAVSFTSDFSEMYYTQCGKSDKFDNACGLFYRYREPDGSWAEAEEIKLFADSVNILHPCISQDGQRLFFSATGDPESYGGPDIYYVKQTEDGWGAPINLGPYVNSERAELFPYLHTDGTLYYSSTGHAGMGGLDIYKTELVKDRWTRPVNMGYPINSGSDDFGLLLLDQKDIKSPDTLQIGFFSSSREGGKGKDDIYRFVQEKAPLPPPVYVLNGEVVTRNKKFGKVDGVPEFLSLEGSTVQVKDLTKNSKLDKITLSSDATFRIYIDSLTDYNLFAEYTGYFKKSAEVSTIGVKGEAGEKIELDVRIILDPIPEPREDIAIRNIYYDFDSEALRPESFPELDILVKLLSENPTLTVELGSHTDSRGKDDYNLDLSQRRAQSVVNYLSENGINGARLVPKGYGETRLINECDDGVECTEDDHQVNRRTTFRVLSDDFKLESEKPDEIRVDPKPDEE